MAGSGQTAVEVKRQKGTLGTGNQRPAAQRPWRDDLPAARLSDLRGPIVAPGFGFWYFPGRESIKRASEGSGMHIDPNECHPAMDYAEHQKTYKLFTKLTLVTIVGVAALMAFLYIFVV
jgi:Bacterial aa3 type cytochrome c oxidase subunit IV